MRELEEAIAAAMQGGGDAGDAVRIAARTVLALDDDAAGRLARIVVAFATEFGRAHDVGALGDAMVIARLAAAVHKADGELRAAPTTELNLPYLSATARGPCHLQRNVSLAELDALGTGVPFVAAPAPAPAASPPPPRKRGWWPFGR